MQNAAGGGIEREPHDQNDAYRSVVSDLISLIEHVRASSRLIETAIARETLSGGQDSAANVIVLDDVSPRYMKAAATLQACDINLATALHSLLDSGRPKSRTDAHAASPFSLVGA